VLLGVAHDDTRADSEELARRVAELRIFSDDEGRMNRSLVETGGAMLVVSQFTLLGDCRKGRRPSYTDAARPEIAEARYEEFIEAACRLGVPTATGRFQASMQVELVNDGPVTLLLESKRSSVTGRDSGQQLPDSGR
jgi:D-tyrosyl-tRNA(Tyr) deacylase